LIWDNMRQAEGIYADDWVIPAFHDHLSLSRFGFFNFVFLRKKQNVNGMESFFNVVQYT
jgi:hypothetical protein